MSEASAPAMLPQERMLELPPGVPPLDTIYWYITGSCNLNCRHCWIDPVFGNRLEKYTPWSEMKPIFEEAQTIGLRSVKVTGGEPFLHPEMIDILYALREMGVSLRMETNGTLIGSIHARALKENHVSFSISLDGPTPELHDDLRGVKGSFRRTMKGIENLRAEGISFQVIFSMHRGNRHGLFPLIDLARSLGANSLKINPISATARGEVMEQAGELLSIAEVLDTHRQLKQTRGARDGFPVHLDLPPAFLGIRELAEQQCHTCGILGILGVLHNGRAGLCGIGEHIKEMDFGDLREMGIARIWAENPILNRLRSELPNQLQGVCGQCVLKHSCQGKCVAHTFYATGNLLAGFPFCEEAHRQGFFPATRLRPASM